jgi:hypothetical protein
MSEYEIYYRAFSAMAAYGDLCRGTECRGYHLSEVDTWHKCGGGEDCAGADAPHPEAAIEEPVEAGEAEADEARFDRLKDEADNRFALDRDGNIPW